MLALGKRFAVVGTTASQGLKKGKHRRAALGRAVAEALEQRQLLSVSSATITSDTPSTYEGNSVTITLTATTDPAGDNTGWVIDTHDGTPLKYDTVYGGTGSDGTSGVDTFDYTFPGDEGASYTVTAQVTDLGGYCCGTDPNDSPINATPQTFNIIQAPVTFSESGPATIDQGDSQLIEVGSYVDQGADPAGDNSISANIDWGDGSSSPAIINGTTVEGYHAYKDQGTFTAAATVLDDGGQAASGSTQVTVTPVVPQVTICDKSDGSEDPDPNNPTGGPQPIDFLVSRTADANGNYNGALAVSLHVSGGSADSADYQTPDTTVTIPDGEASTDYLIKPIDDGDFGPDTTVEVTVDSQTTYQADGAVAEGTIASNDFKITGDTVSWTNAQTVARDDGQGNYGATQWVDNDGDGQPDDNADQYSDTEGAPVSYQANTGGSTTKMDVHVQMQAESGNPNAMPDGTYTIQGTDEGLAGMTWEGTATVNGTVLSADLVSDQPIPSTIFNGQLQIAWTVVRTVPGADHMEGAPGSVNHLYVSGAAASNGAFETVLDVGCRSANMDDPADPGTVLDRVWDTFYSGSVVAADGVTVMKYLHPTGITTASLVQTKTGQCGAWARFMVDVLHAQGVPAVAMLIQSPLQSLSMPVTGDLVFKDVPAQGSGGANYHRPDQPIPNGGITLYSDHVVVESSVRPGNVYDPSYERYSASRALYEKYDVLGCYYGALSAYTSAALVPITSGLSWSIY